MSRCVLGVHSKALACVLCLLLRRARLDLHAEVEQKEIGESCTRSIGFLIILFYPYLFNGDSQFVFGRSFDGLVVFFIYESVKVLCLTPIEKV